MKFKYLVLSALLGLMIPAFAGATTVQYGTAGVFSGCTDVANQISGCAANGNTILFGSNLAGNQGVQLTFIGIASSTTVTAPTAASFGDIVFSCLGGGTACASQVIPTGLVLTINISQTLPTNGSGPIPSATVIGTVSGTSNSGVVTWPVSNTILIGDITYRIANNPLNLVPPSSSNGDTTVQGLITPAPEPTILSLIGIGLFGLGVARRRLS